MVRIGKAVFLEDISLILMDLDHLSDYLETTVDGVIGYDLLSSYVTETNIDKEEFVFYDSETYYYQGDCEPIELTRLESNLFGIMVEVIPKNTTELVELNLEIDSGADNQLVLHNSTVKRYDLIDYAKKHKFKSGFGADSTITRNVSSKVRSVSFGGKQWKHVPVILEVDPINSRKNSLADGLIGQGLLLDFNIVYHLKKGVIYLEPRD